MFRILLILILLIQPVMAETLQGGVIQEIHQNGKTITPFYYKGQQNGYGVQFDNDLYHAYYYDMNGNLTQYDVLDKPRTVFPHMTISYTPSGNIISKSKSVAKGDQYVYSSNGEFIAHWVGNNCYGADGKLLSSKRSLH